MLASLLGVSGARAHPAYLTAAQVTVEADGSFHVAFRFDTLAFALNDSSARIGNEPMEALLAGPREELAATLSKASGRLGRGFKLSTDAGEGTVESVNFPDAAQVLAWQEENKAVLPVVLPAYLAGHLPPGARMVACRFPSVLDQVILTLERPGEEPEAEAVEAGHVSTTWPVHLAIPPPAKAATTSLRVDGRPKLTGTANSSKSFQNRLWSILTMATITFLVGVWVWRSCKASPSVDRS